MMGLDATAGVAGVAAPDGLAGHWMTLGAGSRYRQKAKSTYRSLATISSGFCFLWGIPSSSKWLENYTSRRTTFQGAGQVGAASGGTTVSNAEHTVAEADLPTIRRRP